MTKTLQAVLAERKKARETATQGEWQQQSDGMTIRATRDQTEEMWGYRVAITANNCATPELVVANGDHIVTEHNTGAQVDEALERMVEALQQFDCVKCGGTGRYSYDGRVESVCMVCSGRSFEWARALLSHLGYKE